MSTDEFLGAFTITVVLLLAAYGAVQMLFTFFVGAYTLFEDYKNQRKDNRHVSR